MSAPTIAAAESVPVAYVPEWAPATVTARGSAVLAILRAQDLVRELDDDDKAYCAPYAADLLVEAAVPDLPPTR